MSQYLVLLYAPEADEAEERQRWSELPLWLELTEGLRAAGLAGGQRRTAQNRVRDNRPGARRRDRDDGWSLAVTKEVLVGFYLLDCDGLDEALRHAARFPTAEFGSVEVRPLVGPDYPG